jgi:hypothetical protein
MLFIGLCGCRFSIVDFAVFTCYLFLLIFINLFRWRGFGHEPMLRSLLLVL